MTVSGGKQQVNKIDDTLTHSENNIFIWKSEACTRETDTHTYTHDVCQVTYFLVSMNASVHWLNLYRELTLLYEIVEKRMFFPTTTTTKKNEILSFVLLRLHSDDLIRRYNCMFLMSEHCFLLVLPNYRQIRSMNAM